MALTERCIQCKEETKNNSIVCNSCTIWTNDYLDYYIDVLISKQKMDVSPLPVITHKILPIYKFVDSGSWRTDIYWRSISDISVFDQTSACTTDGIVYLPLKSIIRHNFRMYYGGLIV